tara:strand:+ start:321 stop:1541 length:1221 start_codon:yes stop_codon:yes gene_type:complete
MHRCHAGGLLPRGAPNRPFRGGKNALLEGGVHVRAALGGGYLPPELRARSSRTVLHAVDWYPTLSYLAGLADPRADPLAAAHGLADAVPVDGRNVAPSWRRLYESSVAQAEADGATPSPHRVVVVDELVSSDVADWCGAELGYSRSPGGGAAAAADPRCVAATRLLFHDLNSGSGGHVFSLVTANHSYKVYAHNARPCPNSDYDGCPWDPSHAAWVPNDVCPSADAACSSPPCALGAVSGGGTCALFSPTNGDDGCTAAAPCIFDIATDPEEQHYLTLADVGDATLTEVASWYFAQEWPSSVATYTAAAAQPATSGNGYDLDVESAGTPYLESLYNRDRGQTWDLLGALGTWVLGPFREALPPSPSPPPSPPPEQACMVDDSTLTSSSAWCAHCELCSSYCPSCEV